jgi:hypothetical protein
VSIRRHIPSTSSLEISGRPRSRGLQPGSNFPPTYFGADPRRTATRY